MILKIYLFISLKAWMHEYDKIFIDQNKLNHFKEKVLALPLCLILALIKSCIKVLLSFRSSAYKIDKANCV